MRIHGCNPSEPRSEPTSSLSVIIGLGVRLASLLPLFVAQQEQQPLGRTASSNLARTQVRCCLAALASASTDQLEGLKNQLSKVVQAIRHAPNVATARSLYDNPKVQEILWKWAGVEATILLRNLTRNQPPDGDTLSDMAGEAVYHFMREASQRQGQQKQHPFSMARSWDPMRMPDALGTFRAYLLAWCKGVAKQHYQQQAREGVSLDAPVGKEGKAPQTLRDRFEDQSVAGPEVALIAKVDYQAQMEAISAAYTRQIELVKQDMASLANHADAYSANQRFLLQNRLDAITELVGPRLTNLLSITEAIASVETDKSIGNQERERRVLVLRKQYDLSLSDLKAISEAQERAHPSTGLEHNIGIGPLVSRPTNRNPGRNIDSSLPVVKNKKLMADPLSMMRAYAKARENADLLLPHVYRSLAHRKGSDLSQKYTSRLLTNWRLLDGINSQNDLSRALSADGKVRSTADDRALFQTVALRTMMQLRDLYTHDEKYNVMRGNDEVVPKNAKQRFMQLVNQEIESDAVLRSRAPAIAGMLNEFVSGWGFRSLWENIDHYARAAAYEWARNEKINKRWSDLSPEESNMVADEAGNLLYGGEHRFLSVRSLADPQNRVTHDLDLSPQERQQIMRGEVGRITQMLRGNQPRGPWAHGEPADSSRFHDKLRAKTTQPQNNVIASSSASVSQWLPTVAPSYSTNMASLLCPQTRRFSVAYHYSLT